jgi:hypothetical protein
MNLKEISIENLEGVQDLMQVGCLITNTRGGHELSIVSLETLHLNLLPNLRCIWKGLVPSNLTTLEVNECKRLTHVFTNHYQKTGEKQRNYRRNFSVGNLYRRK